MPRLDDGELATSASKFKKRRAWIISDEANVTLPTNNDESGGIDALPALLIETRVEHDQNKSETRLEHECNKTITKVEHDYNKSITRVEQSRTHKDATISTDKSRLEHECNKTKTRLEHEYNKSVTRVEHDHNKTLGLNSFHAFVVLQRIELAYYDDDARCLLLSLSDVQRRIFWHVAFECINRGDLRTRPIEIKSFFAPLDIATAVVRTSLNRLIEKRLLQREKGKLGKNGFAIISLPKSIYDAANAIVTNFQNAQSAKT